MKYIEKVIKIVFNIILILAVLLFILVAYNFFNINILKHKYSSYFGYTFFEVETGSMSGAIEINDIVIVKITQDVSNNDIITFEQNDEIITHRIINMDDNFVYTKGDANNSSDNPIRKKQIIGKVVKILSNLGLWIKVFSESRVIISIIITILLFGIAISSEDDLKEHEEKESFSRFMRKRRERKNGKSKKKKTSKN